MKRLIIIGGSKGIGKAVVIALLSFYDEIVNISRTAPELSHPNLKHFDCDILKDELPDIDIADGLVYCPGSINLKPINRLSLNDFKTDFDINVIGAVKAIQKIYSCFKKWQQTIRCTFQYCGSKTRYAFSC